VFSVQAALLRGKPTGKDKGSSLLLVPFSHLLFLDEKKQKSRLDVRLDAI
jgi:hypothetical protein